MHSVVKSVIVVVVALACWATPASAQVEKGVMGVGLIVGEPTGISAKYYLSDDHAIDAAIGVGVLGRGIQVHGDYLWHPWELERQETFVMPVYVGLGIRVLQRTKGGAQESHLRVGARGVVGFLFDFTRVPLDVFVEGALVGDYRSKGDTWGLDANVGLGVRYYW